MHEKPTVLLTGATGFIGHALTEELKHSGYPVRPLARSLGQDISQMVTPGDWLPYLDGIDAVVNTVGIISETRTQRFETLHHQAPAALFSACVQAGIRNVVQISALGADEQAFTPYQLNKRAADEHLRALPLDWFVLRPSLVYGKDSRSLAFFRRLAKLPLLPLPDGGSQRIQPVHLEDLTDCVLRCLSNEQSRVTLDVVGPKAMSFAAWIRLLHQNRYRPTARILHIPPSIALTAVRFAHHVFPLAHPDNLRMLLKGNVADARPLTTFLGRPLTDLEAWV